MWRSNAGWQPATYDIGTDREIEPTAECLGYSSGTVEATSPALDIGIDTGRLTLFGNRPWAAAVESTDPGHKPQQESCTLAHKPNQLRQD